STCAVLYAASTPFWYVALARVKKAVSTELVPLLSVFAAFSFVIMMFNLPLPGGTTGHAVGVGIATVVLGPWASMLAVSIALVIQALFFGDGGITAIGANCFNMAIVGSLVAYTCYRAVGLRAGLGNIRRVVAAAFAGYAAINVSALCAAIEFGLQPLLFHDASGAPLYCPYPLRISIPAMMIGHLTFAGLAELIISGGVVAYLQRADPALLRQTAPDAPDHDQTAAPLVTGTLPAMRKLWIGLALLMILTPLGILAGGSAWGEWSARDFSDPGKRQQIASASGNQLPPAGAPNGLQRLSTTWTAPLSGYAPVFIRTASFGYFVSAMVGVGLIILACLLVTWLLRDRDFPARAGGGFVERTVAGLLKSIAKAADAEEIAKAPGFLQRLEPRVKVAGLLSLVIAASSVSRIPALLALFGAGLTAAIASRVPFRTLVLRGWLPALAFSGLIALPAIFLTAGTIAYRLPLLGWPVTAQGLTSATILVLRVETAVTFSVLLVLCTEWARVLRALRFFRVPVTAVVILGMTYRYVFLFLRTALEMFESRQSRMVGTLAGPDRRRLASASVGVLLARSLQMSSEVHAAMRSRGYQGEVYLMDELAIRPADWVRLAIFVALSAAAVLLGR
ncbi:MAG: nickel transporter, partial [Bryobacterales bacterium]|nr:nickel transporter [Bryobacterales bacterium]